MIRSDRLADLAPAEAKQWVERFSREAQLVAALDQHPNLVTLYEAGEQDGRYFFTMQMVRGTSLGTWIADCKLQSAEFQQQIAGLMARVARAVHHAHQRGILHRDLKPGNILMHVPEPSGKSAICNLQSAIPLITDFGLAKRIGSESAMTLSGGIVGTPSYMAPEQARSVEKQRCQEPLSRYLTPLFLHLCFFSRPLWISASCNTPA